MSDTFERLADAAYAARATNPASYGAHAWPLTPEVTARRIVAQFLDAGWTPPTANVPGVHP